MTTSQVLRVLLNKFKIENSPDEFTLFLLHTSGGEPILHPKQKSIKSFPTSLSPDVDLGWASSLDCWTNCQIECNGILLALIGSVFCLRAPAAEKGWSPTGHPCPAWTVRTDQQNLPHGAWPGGGGHPSCKILISASTSIIHYFLWSDSSHVMLIAKLEEKGVQSFVIIMLLSSTGFVSGLMVILHCLPFWNSGIEEVGNGRFGIPTFSCTFDARSAGPQDLNHNSGQRMSDV